jgi:hypothetical protein
MAFALMAGGLSLLLPPAKVAMMSSMKAEGGGD